MAWRWRVRRVAKWGGVITCFVLLGCFAFSMRFAGELQFGTHVLTAWSGNLIFEELHNYGSVSRMPQGRFTKLARLEFRNLTWWPQHHLIWLHVNYDGYIPQPGSYIERWIIPAWMIFVAIGLPTVFLWWLDRRSPPGHCPRCGYNLTGNVSGRCPECGVVVSEGRGAC